MPGITITIANRDEATNHLRFALNELRAMDNTVRCGAAALDPEIPTDRERAAERLQALAEYLLNGGTAPDARFAIGESNIIPVQR